MSGCPHNKQQRLAIRLITSMLPNEDGEIFPNKSWRTIHCVDVRWVSLMLIDGHCIIHGRQQHRRHIPPSPPRLSATRLHPGESKDIRRCFLPRLRLQDSPTDWRPEIRKIMFRRKADHLIGDVGMATKKRPILQAIQPTISKHPISAKRSPGRYPLP